MQPELELILHETAFKAQKFGFLNERAYRDVCIRLEYDRLKNKGVKLEDAEQILAKQFTSLRHKITAESIHRILYATRKSPTF